MRVCICRVYQLARCPVLHVFAVPSHQHLGRVHVAAFSDALLHNELVSKALFWQQTSFYGIDMTPLHQPAVDGYFTQVGDGSRCVVGAALGGCQMPPRRDTHSLRQGRVSFWHQRYWVSHASQATTHV